MQKLRKVKVIRYIYIALLLIFIHYEKYSFYFLWCFPACLFMHSRLPTGNPADFKVKTCLHSIGYAGIWRGQERLTVDEFLEKAKELGYDGSHAHGQASALIAPRLR